MQLFYGIILVSIMLHIAHFCVWIDNIMEGMGYAYYPCVTPQHIYEDLRVNWFGEMFLYILYFICVPLFAIGTFVYWCCTVGRE
jgi:hypothetical protein